jgi:hypothetical protein
LTGWNVSFEDLKWLFDWQMVRGVTQLCQHLQGYSLRGIRKRDYPPSLFYQQPWWDQYGGFNAAVSRIGMLLAEGDPRFEVLVLHPQASAWLHFDNAANPGLRELFEPFLALTNALEAAHVLFHYGDERILRRHGRTRGARLLVGKQSYLAVLVPRCDTLAAETVTLLHRYATKGGQLIWCGRQPTTVEGADAAELGALTSLGLRVDTPGAAVAALPPAVRRVSVTDADGHEIAAISATWRRLTARTAGEPCRFYYFTNADATADHEAEIRVPGAVAVQLGLEDGLLRAMPCAPAGDRVRVRHRFPRRGSLALLVSDRPHGLAHGLGPGPEPPLSETFLPRELFDGAWRLEMMDPNALTLD